MELRREYGQKEIIEQGDVITMRGFTNPFNTYIIADVRLDEQSERIATLARPHMICNGVGTPFVAMETFQVPTRHIRERFLVYTTGQSGEKDNRVR